MTACGGDPASGIERYPKQSTFGFGNHRLADTSHSGHLRLGQACADARDSQFTAYSCREIPGSR